MMEMVVKSLREKSDDASPSKSDPFIWRDKERRYRELLEDCQRFLSSFQKELSSLPDPSNIRGESAGGLLARVRGMVGEGREMRGRELVLLCERLVRSEGEVWKLRDRGGVLAEELMAAEKRREEAERRLGEVVAEKGAIWGDKAMYGDKKAIDGGTSATVPLRDDKAIYGDKALYDKASYDKALYDKAIYGDKALYDNKAMNDNKVIYGGASATMPMTSVGPSVPSSTIPLASTMPSSSMNPVSITNPATSFPIASARYGLNTYVTPFQTHSRSEIDDIIRAVREKVDRLKNSSFVCLITSTVDSFVMQYNELE